MARRSKVSSDVSRLNTSFVKIDAAAFNSDMSVEMTAAARPATTSPNTPGDIRSRSNRPYTWSGRSRSG